VTGCVINYATFGNGHIVDNFYNFMIFVVQSVTHVGILLLSVLVGYTLSFH
jgi:hypothetical protein